MSYVCGSGSPRRLGSVSHARQTRTLELKNVAVCVKSLVRIIQLALCPPEKLISHHAVKKMKQMHEKQTLDAMCTAV